MTAVLLAALFSAQHAEAQRTQLYWCGDGSVNLANEECDDGNGVNGDGCGVDCKIERGHQLSASHGFADDSTLGSCFQRDWNSPGRVVYNGCSGSMNWWDIPMPVGYRGNKLFSVFLKSQVSGGECYAEISTGDGVLTQWSHKTFGTVEQWIDFSSLAMGSTDAAEIQCLVSSASGDYISAVKGF